MKYYNARNALIVVLAEELAVQCALVPITVNGQAYKKLTGEITVVSRQFKNVPAHYIPISKRQAIYLLHRLKAKASYYQYASELWEARRRKSKIMVSSDAIMTNALINMVERELDIYPSKTNTPYFWRKSFPNEN